MPTPLNIGARDIPLRLARTLTDKVNASWDSGEMLLIINNPHNQNKIHLCIMITLSIYWPGGLDRFRGISR